MAESAKKTNIFLLLLTLSLLAGSVIYREVRNKQAAKIGVEAGALAPEISLPDTSGKLVQLSSLRGRYVLVDFWAAWCRPCRRESPNQMRAFEQYSKRKMKNGDGFTILYVSLDENEAFWKQTIQKDMLRGPLHVSDLKGWDSPVVKTYQIKSIPNNLLLDPEGRVIGIHLMGEELHEQLSAYAE
jgi:peroxiredoxin